MRNWVIIKPSELGLLETGGNKYMQFHTKALSQTYKIGHISFMKLDVTHVDTMPWENLLKALIHTIVTETTTMLTHSRAEESERLMEMIREVDGMIMNVLPILISTTHNGSWYLQYKNCLEIINTLHPVYTRKKWATFLLFFVHITQKREKVKKLGGFHCWNYFLKTNFRVPDFFTFLLSLRAY